MSHTWSRSRSQLKVGSIFRIVYSTGILIISPVTWSCLDGFRNNLSSNDRINITMCHIQNFLPAERSRSHLNIVDIHYSHSVVCVSSVFLSLLVGFWKKIGSTVHLHVLRRNLPVCMSWFFCAQTLWTLFDKPDSYWVISDFMVLGPISVLYTSLQITRKII